MFNVMSRLVITQEATFYYFLRKFEKMNWSLIVVTISSTILCFNSLTKNTLKSLNQEYFSSSKQSGVQNLVEGWFNYYFYCWKKNDAK